MSNEKCNRFGYSLYVIFLTMMPIILAFIMGTTTRRIMMKDEAVITGNNAMMTEVNTYEERERVGLVGSEVVIGNDGLPISEDAKRSKASNRMHKDILRSSSFSSGTVTEMQDARRLLHDSYRGRDEAYYESVVHPAMLMSSAEPRRIAIIGQGDGAVLREILKHASVNDVTVFSNDDNALAVLRQTPLPWNSCADIKGSALSCFDDPRVKIINKSGFTKFVQKHSEDVKSLYEIIFVTVLSPKEKIIFANSSFNDATLMKALYNSVVVNGLVVTQLGESPRYNSPGFSLLGQMEHSGFQSFHVYDEVRTQTKYPWSTVIACKTVECRHDFYISSTNIDIYLYDALLPSVSSSPVLKHYDGSTHMRYLHPNMAFETVFCRQHPKSTSCLTLRGLPEGIPVINSELFDIKTSTIGHGGLGLFSTVDIPKGAAIAPDKAIDPVHFTPKMFDLLTEFKFNELHEQVVHTYAVWYGYEGCTLTDEEYYVESGLASFANHGCQSTYNMGPAKDFENNLDDAVIEDMDESSVNFESLINARSGTKLGYGYNPVNDRHLTSFCNGEDYALRNIKAGEEMFTNYLPYVKDLTEYTDNVRQIRLMCGVKDT